MKLLLVEDDAILAENLQILLKEKGYLVDHVISGEAAIDQVFESEYDVILLDWMLPDREGDEVCKILREHDVKTPIIFLTAKNQIEDKVRGLDLGADDYITKPFVIDELLARIRTQVRRNYNNSLQTVMKIGNVSIDTASCEVRCGEKRIELSPKLYALLEYLATNHDKVVTRLDMIDHLWEGDTELSSNVIDAHIKNLRKELSAFDLKAEIRTLKGRGYMLCAL